MADTPMEVTAIARNWGGQQSEPVEVSEGVWQFTESGLLPGEGGFVYRVFAPGKQFAVFEDSGEPAGAIVSKNWEVRCLNDAPDAWFTVSPDGLYRGYGGTKQLW